MLAGFLKLYWICQTHGRQKSAGEHACLAREPTLRYAWRTPVTYDRTLGASRELANPLEWKTHSMGSPNV